MHADKTDRNRIFPEEPTSEYLWCVHCERAYKRGDYRKVLLSRSQVVPDKEYLEMCPYDGCDGDTVIDAWNWKDVRSGNGYPKVPLLGIVYPLYPGRAKDSAGPEQASLGDALRANRRWPRR